MDYTITERQRRFRERMYKAGFKKAAIWLKRKEPPYKELNLTQFVKELRKIVRTWDSYDLSLLLNLFLKIAKSKKEEEKLIKKQ